MIARGSRRVTVVDDRQLGQETLGTAARTDAETCHERDR
jgi:hypothetical protein